VSQDVGRELVEIRSWQLDSSKVLIGSVFE
jgi:hypothetical protein